MELQQYPISEVYQVRKLNKFTLSRIWELVGKYPLIVLITFLRMWVLISLTWTTSVTKTIIILMVRAWRVCPTQTLMPTHHRRYLWAWSEAASKMIIINSSFLISMWGRKPIWMLIIQILQWNLIRTRLLALRTGFLKKCLNIKTTKKT